MKYLELIITNKENNLSQFLPMDNGGQNVQRINYM